MFGNAPFWVDLILNINLGLWEGWVSGRSNFLFGVAGALLGVIMAACNSTRRFLSFLRGERSAYSASNYDVAKGGICRVATYSIAAGPAVLR